MNVAVQGCFHGEADLIFGSIEHIQNIRNIQIDLLLCCGDFQAIRNNYDMHSMACPVKYLQMGTFYKYYCGLKKAPCLTIIIGGNHEASTHMRELYFGGWVAPNIYYLGTSGCVRVVKGKTSLRIGGISGIFSIPSFISSPMERIPFDEKSKYSVYHQKQFDIFKWLLYSQNKVDIFLSHDWPNKITDYGDKNELLRYKKHFYDDIRQQKLGSDPLKLLLDHLQPKYWFSAHLHVKFNAEVVHFKSKNKTKFLALDKCLPGRDWLQILHFNKFGEVEQPKLKEFESSEEPIQLYLDEEWLATVKATFKILTFWDKMPKFFIWNEALKQYQLNKPEKYEEFLTEKAVEMQKFKPVLIQENMFSMTVEPYNPFLYQGEEHLDPPPEEQQINPQMKWFLNLIGETGEELNHFLYIDIRQEQKNFQKELQQKQYYIDKTQQQDSILFDAVKEIQQIKQDDNKEV